MKNYRYFMGVLFLSMFILTGCWTQHDVISIKQNGSISFLTQIEITDPDLSFSDVDELTQEFAENLELTGWTVERTWTSKSPPYTLKFAGTGNLHQVDSETDFYIFQKITDRQFQIVFIPAFTDGGVSSRSIEFDQSFLGSHAKVVDSQGVIQTIIQQVSEDISYMIHL